LKFILTWEGPIDLDLLILFYFNGKESCLVGSKSSDNCGFVDSSKDQKEGNVGGNKTSPGEIIEITEIGAYDY
jgi:hypothetical protein